MYHAGIPLGIILNILVAVSFFGSCTLYIRAKDMLLPRSVESLYEIAYVAIGPKSIYMVAVT